MISLGEKCFICLFLAIQVYLPVDYYFFREDKMDERFAWRMFSDISLSKIEIVFTEENEKNELVPIDLGVYMPPVWIIQINRGKSYLLKRVCEYLCKKVDNAKSISVGATMYPIYKDFPRTIAQINVSCARNEGYNLVDDFS